jgi:predicted PurR-regulated permease PerM
MTTKVIPVLMILWFQLILPVNAQGQTTSTRQDREILIELKAALTQIDKRFEELRQDMNKRFEQVDKRFAELRQDMNKRFEQVDNRFRQFMSFVWILAAIFGAMTGVTIGFALWDRRTMIRPFETKVSELDKRIKINREYYDQLVAALKVYASKNKKFADIIQQFNLF